MVCVDMALPTRFPYYTLSSTIIGQSLRKCKTCVFSYIEKGRRLR